MKKRKLWMQALALSILTVPFMLSTAEHWTALAADQSKPLATRSSPIAITSDDRFVWSVNPDNDSVSVFRVTGDANVKIAEIGVGKEPWCVAITPDDNKVYVTNMASGTVSVINAHKKEVIDTIHVGTEPFGCALTPNGGKLYVANQSSDTVSVINTRRDRVVETIKGVGLKPHGIAITADGKKVFVTQFLALPPKDDPRPLTQTEGADDGREGRVTVINAHNDKVIDTVILKPIAHTGFLSDGSTLAREPIQNPAVFDNVTGAFPNLLESLTIKGDIAYVPGTCSSPNGPFRFNVNVQSCLSTIDTGDHDEAFPTLNMNFGVQNEAVGIKLFNTNPFAVAFKQSADEGFVALAATNRLLRVTLNDDGSATINFPAAPGDPSGIVRIELKDPAEILLSDPDDVIGGKNPRGLVLNSTDTRAYVMDFLSRDIAVVDVSGSDPTQYKTLQRIQSADLPTSAEDLIVQRGKYLFNTSIGPEGTADNSKRPAGLMSDFGWGTCYSCHPQALTDSVTWMFADGPRQAISMESTFEFGAAVIGVNGAPQLPDSHQRALNWSAVRDEVQDFTRNVRAVSGGGGLIKIDANGNPVPEGAAGLGAAPRPCANRQLGPECRPRRHLDLPGARGARPDFAGQPVWYRSESSAVCSSRSRGARTATAGRTGPSRPSTTRRRRLRLTSSMRSSSGSSARWGHSIPDCSLTASATRSERTTLMNVQARGAIGINVPSLISVFNGAPYLHSGAAPTLDDVLDNVTHRTAGRPDHADLLSVPLFRRLVVQFLKSIDRNTDPFLSVTPPVDVCGTGTP